MRAHRTPSSGARSLVLLRLGLPFAGFVSLCGAYISRAPPASREHFHRAEAYIVDRWRERCDGNEFSDARDADGKFAIAVAGIYFSFLSTFCTL